MAVAPGLSVNRRGELLRMDAADVPQVVLQDALLAATWAGWSACCMLQPPQTPKWGRPV